MATPQKDRGIANLGFRLPGLPRIAPDWPPMAPFWPWMALPWTRSLGWAAFQNVVNSQLFATPY